MNCNLAILTILRDCAPRLVPEPTLLAEVRLTCGAVGTTEFADALQKTEAQGGIVSTSDELTGQRKWRITDLGRTWLTERNL